MDPLEETQPSRHACSGSPATSSTLPESASWSPIDDVDRIYSPHKLLACLSLDFETDYGDRLGKTFNILRETSQLEELAGLLRSLDVPVSAFVRTDLLDVPGSPQLLDRLAKDLHCHSHTHATSKFDSRYEIEKTQEAFSETFGRRALGYRAPLGMLYPGDLDLLRQHRFEFSSSIFPVSFPGRYNHRRMPNQPFRWRNGLIELPLGAVRALRVTTALSFVKLMTFPVTRLLYTTLGLPRVVIFNSHLHDFVLCRESYEALPLKLRVAWGINGRAGMRSAEKTVHLLRRLGYEFVTMTEIFEHVTQIATEPAVCQTS